MRSSSPRCLLTFPPIAPASAVLVAALAACQINAPELETDEVAQPLIGGEIAGDDPAVVALLTGSGNILCTGTLITPRAILTAAHCIDMFGADPSLTAFFGTDTEATGLRVGINLKNQHPMWGGSVPSNFDVGVLLLAAPQDPALAVPLNTDDAANHIGEPYRHVGFGVSLRDPRTIDGKKRTGTVTIADVTGDSIISNDADIVVCNGDSGGPGLITVDGTEVVAGIHSYTSTTECFPPGGDSVVDRHVANYLQPWLDENDPSCGRDWLCAPVGCTADPDCEPCGPDGTCATGCELPDPDCGGSGFGDICQTDAQCDEGFCVRWFPDTSFNFCTVECTPGADSCPEGMSCRDVQPFGNVCFYDEPPQGVVGDDCNDHAECGSYICDKGSCVTECDIGKGINCFAGFECKNSGDDVHFYCYAEDTGGGCNAASSRSGGGAALLFLALLALGFRRRQRS